MANGTKEYKIVINGIQESVNAVESLNKQLNDLEQRINGLNSKGVNVSTPKGGGYKGELDAQEKLEKQILETEEKLAQVRDENYKKLLHMKEELKEYTQIAKSQVAAESNAQGLYDTNTMAGMKASLKSIKAEMQTVEIGGDRFNELTRQANELNNKLKEIEQSYGQFGRNVGNYAEGVAEGMSKLKVEINGVTEEFDTAKQAMKTLRNEMQTLSTKKDMGLISEAEEERLKGLIPVVKQLESSIADAGKPMDALLDTMQSVMAIASVGQGIGALFGMDDGEIERTIQKLVALQNVMQGIQVLQQQMQSGEGIGGLLAKGSDMIDKMVTSMLGLTTATKGATVATRALGTALKAIGIGLVIALVAELIEMYKQWSDTQNKAIEEAEAAQEKLRKSIEETRNTYVSASSSYMNAASRLSHLRAEYMATNDQLKKTAILEQATEQFKSLGIEVSGVADAQRLLVQQGDKVIEMIRLQGDAAAIAALRMEAFKKSFNMLIENGYDALGASILAGSNKTVQELDKRQDEIQGQLSKLGKELGVGVKKAGKSVSKAAVDVTDELYKLELDAMRDGLNKELMQLEEEKRQTINKLKANGKATAENITKVEEAFYNKRIKIIKNYLDELDKAVKETAKSIRETKFTIDTKELEQDIKDITTKNWSLGKEQPQNNQLYMSYENVENESLRASLEERLENYKDYYAAYIKEIQDNYRKIKTIRDAQIKLEKAEEDEKAKDEYDSLLESLRKRLEATEYEIAELEKKNKLKIKENKDAYDTLLKNAEEIRQQISDVETNYSLKTVQIEKDMQQKLQDNWIESNENIQEQQNRYYESQIDNFRDFLSKMNLEVEKQPVTDKLGFGIVNVKKTKQNYNEIIEATRLMEIEIMSVAGNVRQAYKDGIIDAETYNAIRKQLIDLQNELNLTVRTVANNQKNLIGEFIQSINQYVQVGLQAVQTVMQAINEYQDYELEKQADFLNKENELIEKKLSEQEDIISRYKEAVDDIEDELSTSRGDRRQHLIDQLNAEISAQRAAMAEEKKLQKQKEANEKKQEELEKKRKQAEYKRNLLQILVSTAMATANGLATQPFVPVGIAMGALATTLGMVQYALAQKAKPYAKGGQLDGGVANGPRHRDGGIPVLGGKASIEGGEFITNRVSTQYNAPLLEFINSRKKRVDISDLIDFYSSGKVKKNINSIKTKFEDGGYIPLPSNLDIKDQLQNIVVNQDNRPIYVTVTDIENKMEDVRYVRTLAGL